MAVLRSLPIGFVVLSFAGLFVPASSAIIEAQTCVVQDYVYINAVGSILGPGCRGRACVATIVEGQDFSTEACRDMLIDDLQGVYVRAAFTPQAPIREFQLTISLKAVNYPALSFEDCVWSQRDLEAGVQLYLDRCVRQAPDVSDWLINPSFTSPPPHGPDNLIWGVLAFYVGIPTQACAWLGAVGVYECVPTP